MAAPKGNNYWQFRDKHGKNPKYTPESLWNEAEKYFKWVESNPLWEEKLFAFQGKITRATTHKMRAMTSMAFCLFADICPNTWKSYKEKEDYMPITTRIEGVIRSQKFEGAAAELLNPNIIARDLGLRDKVDTDVTSAGEKIELPQIYLPDNGRNNKE